MPIQTASITPFHADAAKRDILFHDRIVKSQKDTAHYVIHMHAPRAGEAETYMPAARRLLAESFKDTGDIKGDLMRAVIPHLIDYVPEYARVASHHSQNGQYICMPSVAFSLTDGQVIAVGRPHSDGGIFGAAPQRLSALLWDKPARVGAAGPHKMEQAPPRNVRTIDAEFESQTDPGFDTDRFKPVVQVLATLLAAAEPVRSKILESTNGECRELLPNGPLRVRRLEL